VALEPSLGLGWLLWVGLEWGRQLGGLRCGARRWRSRGGDELPVHAGLWGGRGRGEGGPESEEDRRQKRMLSNRECARRRSRQRKQRRVEDMKGQVRGSET